MASFRVDTDGFIMEILWARTFSDQFLASLSLVAAAAELRRPQQHEINKPGPITWVLHCAVLESPTDQLGFSVTFSPRCWGVHAGFVPFGLSEPVAVHYGWLKTTR